jgi:PAS domain S-box-containing protein
MLLGNDITISKKLTMKIEQLNHVLSSYTDKHKNIESELNKARASQAELEMLNNIIKYAPDLIYWKDTYLRHLGCNDKFAHSAGYKHREDIVGKSDYDFPWRAQAYKYSLDDAEVIRTGNPKLNIEDIVLLQDSSEIRVVTNKVPLRNSQGEVVGVLGISSDITHQKRIETDLKLAKEAAEVANHAKTEFIANMSHDIRTPLSGVVGLAGILENSLDDPTHKNLAHNLAKSGHELLNMLNEILDVISADNFDTNDIHEEAFDLHHLIQSIGNLEQSSLQLKNIQLLTNIDPKIPKNLISDYKKIHHILLNLIGNAIKFTNMGHIEIKITLLERQAEQALLQFQVIDTGKGIPPEALSKVFDAFFRVTPSYKGIDKGHGLGLHIAQTYVHLLNGTISVESILNKGSTFSFTLPLKIADATITLPQPLHKQPLVHSKQKNTPIALIPCTSLPNQPHILIVEDNPIALMVAKTLLNNAKLNPIAATDGESAFELLKTRSFDLILSDVGLPGISGIELARQIRAFEKEHCKNPTPIIGLSAHAEKKTHAICLNAGMNEVIIKPITTELIHNLIRKYALSDNPNHAMIISPHKKPSEQTTAKSALSENLPNIETQLFELEQFMIFDIEKAKKVLGDSETNLIEMIKINMLSVIPEELPLMQQAHQKKDWQSITNIAHKLKGGFIYIGLTRAAMACQYLERYYKAGHTQLLENLYEQVLQTLNITTASLRSFIQ